MTFELYRESGEWRWRLRAGNHEIIASGESYKNKADCLHCIALLMGCSVATIVELEGGASE